MMSSTRSNSENNRFEKCLYRIKQRKLYYFFIFFLVFLLIEIFSLVILFINHSDKGRNLDLFSRHYFLSRIFISPLITFETNTIDSSKTYIGDLLPGSGNWKTWHRSDPIRGWRYGENILVTHYNGRYTYTTNSQGFILSSNSDVYYEKPKKNDTFRIILLGGSTFIGQGSPNPEDNLAAYLNRDLQALQNIMTKERSRKKIEIINAAVGGYFSGQEYLYLINDLLQYEPDLVIVYDGWNDSAYINYLLDEYGDDTFPLWSFSHYKNRDRLDDTYSMGGSGLIFLQTVANNIYSTMLEFGTFYLLRATLKRLTKQDVSEAQHEFPEYNARSVAIYGDNLERIIGAAQFHGFGITIFLQPILGIDGKILSKSEERFLESTPVALRRAFYRDARVLFNRLSEKYVLDSNICVSDLSGVFAGKAESVYADTGHLFPAGNSIVAQAMTRRLSACGILSW